MRNFGYKVEQTYIQQFGFVQAVKFKTNINK